MASTAARRWAWIVIAVAVLVASVVVSNLLRGIDRPRRRPVAAETESTTDGRWSSASTWDLGRVPRPGDIVAVRHDVVLDTDATVGGLTIARAGRLSFRRDGSLTLASMGNVIVQGILSMRPAGADRVHRLVFRGVDESAFRGGGNDPLPTDVGLWVRPSGSLDAIGTPKSSWTRSKKTIPAGARSFTVASAGGWRRGDEIALGPTRRNDDRRAFEVLRIRRVNRDTGRVLLGSATARTHATVRLPNGEKMRPEVLNLTRNVRIEGTPGGRTHIHLYGTGPQFIRFVALRYMGVPVGNDPSHRTTSGRYALHFHHGGGSTRGSVVKGVVARDVGTHAFVPHASHGIAFKRTIAYNFEDAAYWWDRLEPDGSVSLTNGTVYQGCVAANGVRIAMMLQFGLDNAVRQCVTYGIDDDPSSGAAGKGFGWPAEAHDAPGFHPRQTVWEWKDGIAHHVGNPIWVWQIDGESHDIVRPIAYWPTSGDESAALSHGAYINVYHYIDGVMLGRLPIELHASSGWGRLDRSRRQRHSSMIYDAAGAPYAIRISMHSLPGRSFGLIANCTIRNYSSAAVVVDERSSDSFSRGADYTFRNCRKGNGEALSPSDFEIRDIHRNSEICVRQPDGDAWMIDGSGSSYRVERVSSCP